MPRGLKVKRGFYCNLGENHLGPAIKLKPAACCIQMKRNAGAFITALRLYLVSECRLVSIFHSLFKTLLKLNLLPHFLDLVPIKNLRSFHVAEEHKGNTMLQQFSRCHVSSQAVKHIFIFRCRIE